MLVIMIAAAVILFIILSRISSLSQKISSMEWEINKLKGALKPPTEKVESPEPVLSQPATPPVTLTPPTTQPQQQMPTTEKSQAAVKLQIPRKPEPHPSRTREEWEAFVGGKLLNRIGALALVIGMGFFLKYAFDNNWITEFMRVVIGFTTGIGILLGGVRTHKKQYEIFAQGLFGAGISILYLSVFAAFNVYHLIAQTTGFVVMSGITITAFLVALTYDSITISILAWAGGFLTPFLLSTGEANEIGLFSYIALLDVGILAVAMKKSSWIVLEPLTLFATYLIFFLWHEQFYADEALTPTLIFITVFWGLFYVADLAKSLRDDSSHPEIRQLVSFLNVTIYASYMYALINANHHDWMGATMLAICLIYFSNAWIISLRHGSNTRTLAQNVLTATLLLILSTAIQYHGFTTVMFWSLEALVLVWCGVRWQYRYVSLAAFGLFAAALLKFSLTSGAFSYTSPDQFAFLMNYRALTYAALAATVGVSASILRRGTFPEIPILRSILHTAWCLILFGLITVEVNDLFMREAESMHAGSMTALEYQEIMTLMCCWTLYSLPLVYFGLRARVFTVLISGLVVMGIAVMTAFIRGVVFSPVEAFHPLINVRALAMMVVLSGSFMHSVWLKQHRGDYSWFDELNTTLSISLVVLFLWLLTGEVRDVFERQLIFTHTSREMTQIENLQQLSLSGLWLIYGIALMIIGIWRRAKGLRLLAIVLLGISILKIFVYDLSFLETLYRIFSFMGLGIILLGASFMYQKYKAAILDIEH